MTKKRGLGVGSMFYGIGYGFNRADIGSAYIEMARSEEQRRNPSHNSHCIHNKYIITA